VAIINQNVQKTKLADSCRVVCSDWEEFLRRCERREKFDIVFLDPPSAERLIPKVLPKLLPSLKPRATVVCESAEAEVFGKSGMEERFEIVKQAKYGVAYVTVLKLKGEEQ
jgi:16S rRNA G966 N2-methylase RsmD